MAPRVLVLALENWLGTARLPKALQAAGFKVTLLSYPNTLVSLTRYADDRGLCHPSDTAEAVAKRMLDLIEVLPTRLIVPGDDRALRFLQHIIEVAPQGRLPAALVDLARASLPDSSAFKYGADKEAATRLVASFGIQVPKHAPIGSRADLREAVEDLGLPVVIKPLSGRAGVGVQILATHDEVEKAVIDPASTWIAQQYIRGKPAGTAAVALGGKCLGSLHYVKTLTHPGETGPATVVTRLENDDMGRATTAFAQATRFNGFFSPGYMVEEDSGTVYFIEMNDRIVPLVANSGKVGLDLCRALYCGIKGAARPRLDPSAPSMIALYPQELHRDPNSPYREHILDEPLDDPQLHKAMEQGIAMLATGMA